MKRTFTLLLLLCLAGIAHAQIILLDSLTNQPIPAVSVFNADGKLIGLTDSDGKLDFTQSHAVSSRSFKLSFQHISYQNKQAEIKAGASIATIHLSPTINLIEEVAVNNKPKDYVILKGYYRTLETFDGEHKYFSDGIVEYYIPLGPKGRIHQNLIDHRVFGNAEVVAKFKDAMGPFHEPPTVTSLNIKPLNKRLSKDYHIEEGSTTGRILKKGKEAGTVSKLNNGAITQLYVDFVRPDSTQKLKIFRLEGIATQIVNIENYSSTEVLPEDKRNLQSFYSNALGTIKRKKKNGYFPYERTAEFFVMERSFISKEDFAVVKDQLIGSHFLKEESNYRTSYWESLEQYGIPAIDPSLQKQLGKSMKLYDNKK